MALDQRAYGKVKSSKHRTKIINLLKSSPMTPKELAEQTGAALNNISNYLATLRELGLVKCLNNDLRKGRVYALTDKGKEIHSALISSARALAITQKWYEGYMNRKPRAVKIQFT